MGIGVNYSQKKTSEAIFISSHGDDDVHSVSVLSHDMSGHPIEYIPAGQLLAKIDSLHSYAPIKVSQITEAVSSDHNVKVTDSELYKVGNIVEIGTEFRTILSVNNKTQTITLSGDAITASVGDYVLSNRSYNAASVTKQVTGSGSSTSIQVNSVAPFRKGDKVTIKGSSYDLTGVDEKDKTLTVSDDLTLEIGDVVVGAEPSKYKIAIKTVKIKDESNPMVPTQDHGRVRQSALIGFTPSMKKHFPLIVFDERKL